MLQSFDAGAIKRRRRCCKADTPLRHGCKMAWGAPSRRRLLQNPWEDAAKLNRRWYKQEIDLHRWRQSQLTAVLHAAALK
jgi:hypothetical protein